MRRAVRDLDPLRMKHGDGVIETVHLKREMSQIGLDLHRSAAGEVADLNFLVALWRFQEDQLGTSRGFMSADFVQTENLAIKRKGLFEIVDSVSRVQELSNECHGREIRKLSVMAQSWV